MALIAEIIGIGGALLVIFTYFLISANRITADDARYQWLNGASAIMVLFSLAYDWNSASFLIEIAWLSISVYGLTRIYRKRRHAA